MSVAGLGAAFARAYAIPSAALTTTIAPVAPGAATTPIAAPITGNDVFYDKDEGKFVIKTEPLPELREYYELLARHKEPKDIIEGLSYDPEKHTIVSEGPVQQSEPLTSRAPAGPALSVAVAPAPATPTADTNQLNALTNYIPGDVLTFYLGASAAITGWAATHANTSETLLLPQPYNTYSLVVFLICLFAAPLWAYFSAQNACPTNVKLTWQAWGWPVIAAPIAFAAYSLAIPSTWFSNLGNASLFATFAVLGVT
jgi:hypothetical protein